MISMHWHSGCLLAVALAIGRGLPVKTVKRLGPALGQARCEVKLPGELPVERNVHDSMMIAR